MWSDNALVQQPNPGLLLNVICPLHSLPPYRLFQTWAANCGLTPACGSQDSTSISCFLARTTSLHLSPFNVLLSIAAICSNQFSQCSSHPQPSAVRSATHSFSHTWNHSPEDWWTVCVSLFLTTEDNLQQDSQLDNQSHSVRAGHVSPPCWGGCVDQDMKFSLELGLMWILFAGDSNWRMSDMLTGSDAFTLLLCQIFDSWLSRPRPLLPSCSTQCKVPWHRPNRFVMFGLVADLFRKVLVEPSVLDTLNVSHIL